MSSGSDRTAPSDAPLDRSQLDLLAAAFSARYGVSDHETSLVLADAAGLGRVVGPDQLQGRDRIWVAFASGDLTDVGAHPPYGYELPTGKTAYWLLDEDGEVLGSGLLIEERSHELEALGEVHRLSEARAT